MQKYNLRVCDTKTMNMFLLNKVIRNEKALEIQYNSFVHPIEITNPKKVECLSIILFEQANGYIKIDGERHKVTDRMAMVVFPGQVVTCDLKETTFGHYIMSTNELFERATSINSIAIGRSKPMPAFKLNESNFYSLLQEFLEIKKLLIAYEKQGTEIIISRFKTIYLILKSRNVHAQVYHEDDIKSPFLKKFLQVLEESYRYEKSVQYYADATNISPNYLNKLCKRNFNVSAKQFIKDKMITEAKRLLLATDQSIKETAFYLGFANTGNFSNFFKKESGFYPRDFIQLRLKEVDH